MRRDVRDWIAKDDDRRRVYETDALYHAQAASLSLMLDTIEMSLHASGVPIVAVATALQAAVSAVLGDLEAAEARAREHAAEVKRLTSAPPSPINPQPDPLHRHPGRYDEGPPF
jgi:hypothetical protein